MAVAAAWSAGLLVAQRAPSPLYRINLVWVEIVLVAATVLGGLFVVTGHGPRDPLHAVYGILAVAALPIAASFASGRPQRHQAAIGLVATVVLLILVLRLFQTAA